MAGWLPLSARAWRRIGRHFSKWWKDIEKKYNVRANIGISGKEYAKYGTTFDNQILVIDKTGATTQPVLTGKVESVAELPTLLEGIRNERQQIQRSIDKPAVNRRSSSSIRYRSTRQRNWRRWSLIRDSAGTQSIGNGGDTGASTTDSKTLGESAIGDVVNDGIGAGEWNSKWSYRRRWRKRRRRYWRK